MTLHLFTRHRGIGTADTGIYHTQIVIYLRTCRDGGTRISGVDLLLDRDCRRYALDQLDIGLGHTSQELPRI